MASADFTRTCKGCKHVRKEQISKSDIVYRSLQVLQNRGLHNCKRTPEVEAFEKAWLERVRKIKMKGRIRAA